MRWCLLGVLFFGGCASSWVRLQYESLGYVHLAIQAMNQQTPPCVHAAVSFAHAAQLVLEKRAAESLFSMATHNLSKQAQQSHLLMEQECLNFGIPQTAITIGIQLKERAHVGNF